MTMSQESPSRELLLRNKTQYLKYAGRFQTMFHVRLWRYWDIVTGFDLIKFDEQVIQSADRCMKEVTQETYGDEAVTLIKALIGSKQPE